MIPLARRAFRRATRPALLAAIGVLFMCGAPAEAACTLRVDAAVAFGSYSIFAPTPLDTTGRFDLFCTFPSWFIPYSISLSRGNSGTYTDRRLISGSEFLLYNLYRDAARTIVWGDGTGGTQVATGQYNILRIFFNVYGRIPALQDAAVGVYSDTIVITVNY